MVVFENYKLNNLKDRYNLFRNVIHFDTNYDKKIFTKVLKFILDNVRLKISKPDICVDNNIPYSYKHFALKRLY